MDIDAAPTTHIDPVFGAVIGHDANHPERYKDLGDGTYVLAKPLMFHWTVVRGAIGDTLGYFDRWCFTNQALAQTAVDAFPINPPEGFEPPGWHRHPKTGRRRENGDPNQETLNW